MLLQDALRRITEPGQLWWLDVPIDTARSYVAMATVEAGKG
jgi:hypothetical protein